MKNLIIMYLPIVLVIVLGESSLKINFKPFSFSLIWDKNLGSYNGWPVGESL